MKIKDDEKKNIFLLTLIKEKILSYIINKHCQIDEEPTISFLLNKLYITGIWINCNFTHSINNHVFSLYYIIFLCFLE
jgi:hypothetical protein